MGRGEVEVLYTHTSSAAALLFLSLPRQIQQVTMADQGAKLEQYIILAKSARGESAAKLILNAISAVGRPFPSYRY